MDRISTYDVADAAGTSYRRVDYWCRTGVLHPARPARGSGSQRHFTHHETLIAAAVSALADMGAQGPVLGPAAAYLRHTDPADFAGVVFVTPTGEVVHDVELAGPSAWLLDLGTVARKVMDRRHSLVAA